MYIYVLHAIDVYICIYLCKLYEPIQAYNIHVLVPSHSPVLLILYLSISVALARALLLYIATKRKSDKRNGVIYHYVVYYMKCYGTKNEQNLPLKIFNHRRLHVTFIVDFNEFMIFHLYLFENYETISWKMISFMDFRHLKIISCME